MARKPIGKGQKTGTNGPSGQKSQSATSTSHKGSRVEPSHITQQKREGRAKKTDKGR
ncbi:MAG TPA: hypothetical protein VHN77_11805 [Phycisphaerales bacterium]|nr:hypothetical protein [Phycisphaerales bacterium]